MTSSTLGELKNSDSVVTDVADIEESLATKATASTVSALQNTVSSLAGTVSGKADSTDVTAINNKLELLKTKLAGVTSASISNMTVEERTYVLTTVVKALKGEEV